MTLQFIFCSSVGEGNRDTCTETSRQVHVEPQSGRVSTIFQILGKPQFTMNLIQPQYIVDFVTLIFPVNFRGCQ